MIDWNEILSQSLVAFFCSAGTWLATNIIKLRKDMDAAFCKIRQLQGETRDVADDWEDDPSEDPDRARD